MDRIDYAQKLVKEFPHVLLDDALKALDTEANDLRNDPFQKRKPTYPAALESAYEHLQEWLRTGDQYQVKLDYADIARFASSHRKACVWAVLTTKGQGVPK